MKYLLFILLTLPLLVISCTKSEFLTEGDYFFLEHKKAKMPIWVKGNLDSDVFIIMAHGGPGGSGHEFPLSHGFQYLEEDYALVYYDQRLSGLAQGDPDTEVNADIFIEDLEKLVELIRQKYDNPTLFLGGHSWGGQLTAGYLGRENHQDLFNGWIDIDGSIYGALEAEIMRDWILERVPAKLETAEGSDKEFWEYVYEWYDSHPNPLNGTDEEPYLFAGALDGYAYDWEKTQELNPTPYKDLIFSSMFSFSFYIDGIASSVPWIDNLNFTPELQQITIPSLLIWGEQDGAVPAAVGDYVYEYLATDPEHKTLIKIPECSHSPHYDQPDVFYAEVSAFIETYK